MFRSDAIVVLIACSGSRSSAKASKSRGDEVSRDVTNRGEPAPASMTGKKITSQDKSMQEALKDEVKFSPPSPFTRRHPPLSSLV